MGRLLWKPGNMLYPLPVVMVSVADKTGKANGRGAYVCKDKECYAKLCKQKSLNKAFKCNVPAEVYEKIGKEFE